MLYPQFGASFASKFVTFLCSTSAFMLEAEMIWLKIGATLSDKIEHKHEICDIWLLKKIYEY